MTVVQNIAALVSEDAPDKAIALASGHLAKAPGDAPVRHALIDLLIVSGDLARADKHADVAAKLAPQDAVGLARLRRRMRGMFARQAWWREAATPDFPLGPTPCDEAALRLNLALRGGSTAEVSAARDALDAVRGERPAAWNGETIADLRDLDDRIPHAIEAITDGGSYLWVDLALVRSLVFAKPARLRDFAYPRARLDLTDGSSAEILTPAIYPEADDAPASFALGRETAWIDGPGGIVTGRGLRCFLAGEEMRPLLDAETIEPEPQMADTDG